MPSFQEYALQRNFLGQMNSRISKRPSNEKKGCSNVGVCTTQERIAVKILENPTTNDVKQEKINQTNDKSTSCDLTSSASNPRRPKESRRVSFDEQIFQNRSKMYDSSSCQPKIHTQVSANDRSNNSQRPISFKEFISSRHTDAF